MTQLPIFRRLSMIEGISLLLLVFIAMPIKYIGGNPLPVRYVGMIHGILFIAFVVQLLMISVKYDWSKKFILVAGFSSVIPFGMLYLDKKLKQISVSNE